MLLRILVLFFLVRLIYWYILIYIAGDLNGQVGQNALKNTQIHGDFGYGALNDQGKIF